MEWNKYTIRTTAEGTEPICALLLNSGINGMEIDDPAEREEFFNTPSPDWDYVEDALTKYDDPDVKVIFYLSDNPYGAELLMSVKDGLARLKGESLGLNLGSLALESETGLDDEVWLNKWKEYYKPFPVGEKLYIKPLGEEGNPNGRITVKINPGNVFGTGLHRSTQLCLEQLEKHIKPGYRVADLGCGSGILAITALLLGAEHAFAVDIDKNAETAVRENAAQNGIDKSRLTFRAGNILTDGSLKDEIAKGGCRVAVANIVADVINAIAKDVYNLLDKGGIFISSGIIKDRMHETTAAVEAAGFKIISIGTRDEWCQITAEKR